MSQRRSRPGGIVHTYQKYDPKKFPDPREAGPDMVSAAFDHMLAWGGLRELTEEELARAIRLDPGQFAGLGPSLQALIAMLEERRRRILEKYETESVQAEAAAAYVDSGRHLKPPRGLRKQFDSIFTGERLLTTPNPGDDEDAALLDQLGMRPAELHQG